ncbi:MAG: flavodoxin family protein [Chitinivibrionales bacterium]
MKIIGFNGSPRKEWNTATLVRKALEGAASKGAQTELIHLYDLKYSGCISCFSCKLKGGKSYGKCAVKDDLQPIFGRIEESDAIILGSPVYLGAATGEMRSFLERLTFPYLVYDQQRSSLFKSKMPVGFIYTLGASEGRIKEAGWDRQFTLMESILNRIFGASETLLATETYQFDDYSKYVAPGMDAEARARRRKEMFPEDCRRAFEMGVRFAEM